MPQKPGRCPMCRKPIPAEETTRTRAGKPIHAACLERARAKAEKVASNKGSRAGRPQERTGKPTGRARGATATAASRGPATSPGATVAKFTGQCPLCPGSWVAGDPIRKSASGAWAHAACVAAEREFRRNQEAVMSGETFRSQRPSDWRRGASPSSTRTTR